MKFYYNNGEPTSASDEVFSRLGVKKCSHLEHKDSEGCVKTTIVDVDHPYYMKTEKFPNGYSIFLSTPNRY